MRIIVAVIWIIGVACVNEATPKCGSYWEDLYNRATVSVVWPLVLTLSAGTLLFEGRVDKLVCRNSRLILSSVVPPQGSKQ